MTVLKSESISIQTQNDMVVVRQAVRAWAAEMGMSIIDQTKIVTAASEIARNTFDYGGGGAVLMEQVEEPPRRGLRLTFEDHGPGIPDIDQALKDGFTSGKGMGLGLGGSKRLTNEFKITSEVGVGTRVVISRWK